jgi:glycosyltransferase involved in cell wall biosynthesis
MKDPVAVHEGRPNRILFIANQYYPHVVGGAELSVQTLGEELLRMGMQICVISLSPNGHDSIDEVNGIRVHRLAVDNVYTPFTGPKSALQKFIWHSKDVHNSSMAAKVAAVLDIERPQWVSTHNIGGLSVALWQAIKARGIGVNHVLHDYYLLCPRTTMFSGGSICGKQCGSCRVFSMHKRTVSRMVDVVIGVSGFVLQAHLSRNYFPNASSAVIHNGRHPMVSTATHAGSDELQIGFIGRIEPSKGIEVLLEAVSLLSGRWQLRIAGKPQDDAYLAHLRQKFPSPRIEFLGYAKADQFYPTLDVLVVPSLWHEPLPGVVYEPMGFGVPVIASRVGGIPEMLEGTGAGWLFEPGDVHGLRDLLQPLIHSREPLQSRRQPALNRAAHFVPLRQAEEFLDAIHLGKIRDRR